jgi:hypothetical protein
MRDLFQLSLPDLRLPPCRHTPCAYTEPCRVTIRGISFPVTSSLILAAQHMTGCGTCGSPHKLKRALAQALARPPGLTRVQACPKGAN